jgi:hypothetical protein
LLGSRVEAALTPKRDDWAWFDDAGPQPVLSCEYSGCDSEERKTAAAKKDKEAKFARE